MSINMKFIIPQMCLSFCEADTHHLPHPTLLLGYISIIHLFTFIADSYLMLIHSAAAEGLCCF